jgi:hypothetical protein
MTSGAKAHIIFNSYGTTEVVPFPSVNAALKRRSSTALAALGEPRSVIAL